jgi:hypothetical protein
MQKTVLIASLTIGLLTIPFLVHAEVYKWIDDKGTIFFTDDYSNIPPAYQDRLKLEIRKDIQWQEPHPLAPEKIIPRSKEEAKTHFYWHKETWQKEKVRLWEEKLKEATANYESANMKVWEKSEALSRRRFGSPTMYKFDIIKLDQLNEERMKYEPQVAEANEMLRKLSEEAEKTTAIQKVTPSKGEEIKTDIYGIGENWWRDRVRPWKENLKELNAGYGNEKGKFMGKATELSKRRYGNRHTIKASIIELDQSNKEVSKYKAQIAENEEMLKRISKDAEESRANPDWLE